MVLMQYTHKIQNKTQHILDCHRNQNDRRVCRRFYFLAWEPELWERLSFLGEENLDIDRALKTTFQLVVTMMAMMVIAMVMLANTMEITLSTSTR